MTGRAIAAPVMMQARVIRIIAATLFGCVTVESSHKLQARVNNYLGRLNLDLIQGLIN